MSELVDKSLPEVSEVLGTDGQGENAPDFSEEQEDEAGEESDEYELNEEAEGYEDQEGDEDGDEEENSSEKQAGLTAMLLGNPAVGEEEEEEEAEGDEEYVEEAAETAGVADSEPPRTNNKKRSISDLVEEANEPIEESETKKAKA